MKKRKIAMLIMVDGIVLDEKYYESKITPEEEWSSQEEAIDPALWFFY